MNWIRRVVTIVVLSALLVPVLRDDDSFPLSTYPMYSSRRGETIEFVGAVGVDGSEVRRRLGLGTVGDSDDPLIVSSMLRQAASSGGAVLDALCGDIARRAAVDDSTVVAVEIVSETHDVVAGGRGDPSVIESRTLTRCEVGEL